jgi:hypothetical protein
MAAFFGSLDGRTLLGRFLRTFYPERPTSQYNLEEVMAFLDIARHRSRVWGYARTTDGEFDAQHLYELLLDFVKQQLTISPGVCDLHARLFESLDPRDSVMTVNYDLVADQALQHVEAHDNRGMSRRQKLFGLLGDPQFKGESFPTLRPAEREGGFYLKLHGSLDWLYCPTPSCPNHSRFYAGSLARFGDGQEEGRPCRLCGASIETYLIPPVATKRLDDRGRMALLWNLALREIRAAAELVVIGLSFAPTDFELRWLVREAVTARAKGSPLTVTIADPSPESRNRIATLLPRGAGLGRHFRSLQEYVEFAAA